MTEPITIGVDHGYAAMKTAHCSFPSGLAEYEHEPYTQKNVLCYDGKYYVVGSGRQPLQQDKTVDENYYLLTLAAIAKEIAYRNAPTTTSVILAAGLPLTSFGREKKAFRAYLLREGKPVSFSYEGISYETSVQDVKLFPQGYAAILQHSDLLNEPSVILADIGGWTVDIMRLDNRIPNAASCRSLELGMIRCLDEIAEQVRRSLNLSLTSVQIENVLRGSPGQYGRPCESHHPARSWALCQTHSLCHCRSWSGLPRYAGRVPRRWGRTYETIPAAGQCSASCYSGR